MILRTSIICLVGAVVMRLLFDLARRLLGLCPWSPRNPSLKSVPRRSHGRREPFPCEDFVARRNSAPAIAEATRHSSNEKEISRGRASDTKLKADAPPLQFRHPESRPGGQSQNYVPPGLPLGCGHLALMPYKNLMARACQKVNERIQPCRFCFGIFLSATRPRIARRNFSRSAGLSMSSLRFIASATVLA